jgi:hypothetical protein
MARRRDRTLSDEGVKLYLDGMMPPPPTKKTLAKFLFSCFHSDWDDKVDFVVNSCRQSTKSLYGELWENDSDVNYLHDKLNSGITNTVRIILSNDEKKVKIKHIMHNYRFFLEVMRNAFETNDHQTAMMMYISLTHMSINRLKFKRPKKSSRLFEQIKNSYGDMTSCYSKHLIGLTSRSPDAKCEYLPSLIACSTLLDTKTAFKKLGHNLDHDTVKDIKDNLHLLMILCYGFRGGSQKIYSMDGTTAAELFELSNQVRSGNSPRGRLFRTKKQYPNLEWQKNKIFGTELETTSTYVTNNRAN